MRGQAHPLGGAPPKHTHAAGTESAQALDSPRCLCTFLLADPQGEGSAFRLGGSMSPPPPREEATVPPRNTAQRGGGDFPCTGGEGDLWG